MLNAVRKNSLALLSWLALALPGPVAAIGFDEIREYGDVFRISAEALGSDLVEVRWEIEPGYYLYANKFLSVASMTPEVVLDEIIVPEGKKEFDPLLGQEVVKFHQLMKVSVPLASVEAGATSLLLKVRSQGCQEDVLCYPPTYQEVTIDLLNSFEDQVYIKVYLEGDFPAGFQRLQRETKQMLECLIAKKHPAVKY